ncbi:MAG: hypothetical protein AAFX06_31890 [Planctomycetota bacterium]
MRIDPNNSIQRPVSQRQESVAPRSKPVSGEPATSVSAVDVGSLDALLTLLADSGKIREAVVVDVQAKIQSGEYLAKASAYETASAILDL